MLKKNPMYIIMDQRFFQNNIVAIAISIFITSYTFIVMIKPHFLYNKDGSLREFGVGFKKKTVVPVWLLSIMLGILSYYSILHLAAMPKLLF